MAAGLHGSHVGECIVPDGAYHANEHVYERAVFRFADTYLPRFPLFVIRSAYDAIVSGSVFCCRGASTLSVAALRASQLGITLENDSDVGTSGDPDIFLAWTNFSWLFCLKADHEGKVLMQNTRCMPRCQEHLQPCASARKRDLIIIYL